MLVMNHIWKKNKIKKQKRVKYNDIEFNVNFGLDQFKLDMNGEMI